MLQKTQSEGYTVRSTRHAAIAYVKAAAAVLVMVVGTAVLIGRCSDTTIPVSGLGEGRAVDLDSSPAAKINGFAGSARSAQGGNCSLSSTSVGANVQVATSSARQSC